MSRPTGRKSLEEHMAGSLARWSMGLYTVGAFAVWVLVGAVADWRKGTEAGAIVALFGVGLGLLAALASGRVTFGLAFVNSLMFAAFPIGMLAWANGAHGYVWWWTTLIIGSIGLGLTLLIQGVQAFEKKYGT